MVMGRLKQGALKRKDAARAATKIGDLVDKGLSVFCWCNRCGHSAQVDAVQLAAELGPDFPVPDIGQHMRCSGCASKDVATRPDWPSLGHVTRHD